MYGEVFILERDGQQDVKAERLAFGDTAGKDERWLRDKLFERPDLIPVTAIDPSFGPMVPLCIELGTEAGPLDIAFISQYGRLTLVECKLWRNPEARRKVVAQILDYARAISRWSYSDLQRRVAVATGQKGNYPFEQARKLDPHLDEHHFIDQTVSAMRGGRFLLLIAGDGIREDVSAISDLINRNAASGFTLGLVEIALYGLEDGGLLIQPRVMAKTLLIERTVITVKDHDGKHQIEVEDESEEIDTSISAQGNQLGESPKQAAFRAWWQPVLDAKYDDPDQEQPRLYYPNYVKAPLPWTKTFIYAYRMESKNQLCVTLDCPVEVSEALAPYKDEILKELPPGTEYGIFWSSVYTRFRTLKKLNEFKSEDEKRSWLIRTINQYSNALRSRIKEMQKKTIVS